MSKKKTPVVTVLGHVDHGKTTLLDAIRSTKIADREAGGITQAIGASKINTSHGAFTLIDTPGHAAFSKMRSRGANVADVAILVVATDDGPMPQTLEALKFIKEAAIPFIVAFTKTDLPSSNLESSISKMEAQEVLFEGRGGDTPFLALSAKNKEGIDELLELIQLVAEVSDVDSDPDGPLEAVVVEAHKDKRGSVATVIVRNGTLKIGTEVTVGNTTGKVRGMFDDNNKPVKEALPGDPVVVLGFEDVPEVGASVLAEGDAKMSARTSESRKIQSVDEDEVGVLLKADSTGALEALLGSIPEKVIVVASSVGDLSDSDIFLAKSTDAKIALFGSRTSSAVKKLAEQENVDVDSFRVIYELIDYLKSLVKEKAVDVFGKAEVLAKFPFNKLQVAGCKIIEGVIKIGDPLTVVRGDKEVAQVKIKSLKRGKEDLKEAKVGEECGIIFVPQLDFEIGDVLVSRQPNKNGKLA